MLRRLAPAVATLLLAAVPLRAQLGMITVPNGSLRIDIVGAFYPNDQVWVNGARQPIGSFINGTANPAISALQTSLATLAGQSVSGLSLGGITAFATRDHGVGDIGFAFGLTKRITVFGYAPIVFVRSRVTTTFDPATSRVGLNPQNSDPALGSPTAQGAFFNDFQIALDTIQIRIAGGFY